MAHASLSVIKIKLWHVEKCKTKACPLIHTFADFPEATLRFANYYGDHMVLQRAPHSANVWSFMPACDDKVEVTFGETNYKVMLSEVELVCIH